MISVIVPVYNVEKYLRKSVESIQNQTYTDLEIILIDDGSPDKCGIICDELAKEDKRIRVIHQKNGGQAKARNQGLAFARGEYITFVDSDDTIEPQMMETLLKLIEENEDIDISICGHKIVCEEENPGVSNAVLVDRKKILNQQELWQEIFGKLNNAVWNKMYKSSLLDNLQFPQGIIHGEDLLFNLEYLIRCKKGIINPIPLYNYLKREGSVTGSKFSKNKLYEIQSKDMALEIVEQYMPEQAQNGRVYCFRARMNVIRAIYKAECMGSYSEELRKYREYITTNFVQVKRNIRFKEYIEYRVYTDFPWLYKIIVKYI